LSKGEYQVNRQNNPDTFYSEAFPKQMMTALLVPNQIFKPQKMALKSITGTPMLGSPMFSTIGNDKPQQ
jgi:hypothetical protein